MQGSDSQAAVGRLADRWVRVGPAGRWAGFTVCGLVGLALALAWTLALAVAAGRPAWLALVVAGGMLTGLVAAAAVEALVVGRPRLVCFHGELAAFAVTVGALLLADLPVVAALDLAVPGLAVFLACGRVGCLVTGCCHGRPAVRGIRYGARHAAEGLPAEYVGVPLFPVAAVEAAVFAGLAGALTVVVLSPAPAGAALSGYLLVHVAARFWLEFLRGDVGRAHFAGLSEAQWTALAVTLGVGLAVTVGWDVLPGWLPVATGVSLAAGLGLVATRPERVRLRGPAHVLELARIVRCADAARGGLVRATTGLGVRVSASAGGGGGRGGPGFHYAFSRPSGVLRAADAAALGRIAATIGSRGQPAGATLYRSGNGVFHLMADSSAARGTP